jgi:lipopolysaccharide transport system ATP-binding protein
MRTVLQPANLRTCEPANENTIWALKDVSFEVKRGEVVGVIGRNGAGKSTLLKILSRITRPTEGQVRVRGRVGSLLEVGTGFHPELTGRENIYLNGAILGMKRAEIVRKFDAIVAFAEIEKFIDTPVKHYSSGMYMRLAFAVAAHLEPEILIVDEVLAVGDAQFQKKCLGKMGEVAQEGRTVLFVSHQLNQIQRLTNRAIWMDAGQIKDFDKTLLVARKYEAALLRSVSPIARADDDQHVPARFMSWHVAQNGLAASNILTTSGPISISFCLKVNQVIGRSHFGVALYNVDDQLMWANATDNLQVAPGTHSLEVALPILPLRPGVYHWLVSLYGPDGLIDLWNCSPDLFISTEPVTHATDTWQGILNLPCTFAMR